MAVHEAPYWKKITLQAGLHGELNLWTNAENYGNVLTLVREYVAKERKIMIKKILGIAVLFGLMMTAAQAKTFLVDVRTPSEIATTGKVEGAFGC